MFQRPLAKVPKELDWPVNLHLGAVARWAVAGRGPGVARSGARQQPTAAFQS